MEYTPRYGRFRSQLRLIREEAGLSQVALAKKLGRPQSFVSKSELGERQIDFLEAVDFCLACNVSVAEFLDRLEPKPSQPKAALARLRKSMRKSKSVGV